MVCVCGMQKSAGPGDVVVNAELHLLERLLGRISKQVPSSRCKVECIDKVLSCPLYLTDEGDTFHLRLFSESDDEEEERLAKKYVLTQ